MNLNWNLQGIISNRAIDKDLEDELKTESERDD